MYLYQNILESNLTYIIMNLNKTSDYRAKMIQLTSNSIFKMQIVSTSLFKNEDPIINVLYYDLPVTISGDVADIANTYSSR